MERNERDIPTERYEHPPYSSHTPGPWKVVRRVVKDEEGEEYRAFHIDAPSHRTMAELFEPHPAFRKTAEAEANANLIAAAPDLLAALKSMLTSHGDLACCDQGECLSCREARQAVARAEGQGARS